MKTTGRRSFDNAKYFGFNSSGPVILFWSFTEPQKIKKFGLYGFKHREPRLRIRIALNGKVFRIKEKFNSQVSPGILLSEIPKDLFL